METSLDMNSHFVYYVKDPEKVSRYKRRILAHFHLPYF